MPDLAPTIEALAGQILRLGCLDCACTVAAHYCEDGRPRLHVLHDDTCPTKADR